MTGGEGGLAQLIDLSLDVGHLLFSRETGLLGGLHHRVDHVLGFSQKHVAVAQGCVGQGAERVDGGAGNGGPMLARRVAHGLGAINGGACEVIELLIGVGDRLGHGVCSFNRLVDQNGQLVVALSKGLLELFLLGL